MRKVSSAVVAIVLAVVGCSAEEATVYEPADARELGLRARAAFCELRATCSKRDVDVAVCTGRLEDAPVITADQASACERFMTRSKCDDPTVWMDPPPVPCPELVFEDGTRFP